MMVVLRLLWIMRDAHRVRYADRTACGWSVGAGQPAARPAIRPLDGQIKSGHDKKVDPHLCRRRSAPRSRCPQLAGARPAGRLEMRRLAPSASGLIRHPVSGRRINSSHASGVGRPRGASDSGAQRRLGRSARLNGGAAGARAPPRRCRRSQALARRNRRARRDALLDERRLSVRRDPVTGRRDRARENHGADRTPPLDCQRAARSGTEGGPGCVNRLRPGRGRGRAHGQGP